MRAYACLNERRRAKLGEHPTFVGIDYLEVSRDQRTLKVSFVPKASGQAVPAGVSSRNVRIAGGTRIRRIRVEGVIREQDKLIITVNDDDPGDGVGDFSPYALRLVDVKNLDPLFSEVTFSFKAGCPTEFDCRTDPECPAEPPREPELDYLAKDYASFRRLMLDRLSVLMPDWDERNPADLQVAVVELLAYVGDYLSYQQDAVATEAYLDTARRRISTRRHARLVDYFMHDGSNARVWAQVRVSEAEMKLPKGTRLLTRTDEPPGALRPERLDAALAAGAEVFETMHEVTLRAGYDDLKFYTWGDAECCLPKGATGATLRGRLDGLAPGQFLVIEEVLGPRTGAPADADPDHRHPVRLIRVSTTDNEGKTLTDPLYGEEITEIEWHPDDALPFSVCVSTRVETQEVADVSVARANIVLADHGLTIKDEPLGAVPDQDPVPRVRSERRPDAGAPDPVFPRFRPSFNSGPLTQAARYVEVRPGASEDDELRFMPAASAMRWPLRETMPAASLRESESLEPWLPRRDLLDAGPSDRRFVAEVEANGRAYLRFGDDTFGLRPARGALFTARYRVGNGTRGNVGADAIAHVLTTEAGIKGLRNPLPARGGVEPETIEEVRQSAPSAFRVQERAVTPEDYAEVARRHPQVQRAAATVRWTGSWHTVFLVIDRLEGREVDEDVEKELRAHLERYRLAGHDLEIAGPHYAALEVEMSVCVLGAYFRSDVKAALLEVLSNRTLPDGRRGVFHPDNFTFGQPVYVSRIYEAVQAVEGVDWVEITKFQRQRAPDDEALKTGQLSLHRLEIARLDNDPNFPENGVLGLFMEGGR